jgi:hypothetical protein
MTRADPVDSARHLIAVAGNVAIIRCYMHIRRLFFQYYGDQNYFIRCNRAVLVEVLLDFFQFYGDQNIFIIAATERY